MASAEPKLTAEQRAAVTARSASVSLSAGAGCGKTFVLTERFLSHLEPDELGRPGARLSELVAITFTDKAAREMRDRIRAKCYERLQSCGDRQADYWLDLLRQLDAARVSTIHAFCAALLRSHAVEAGLDPGFTVLDAVQAATLVSEAVDDELRRQLTEAGDDFIELVALMGLERLGDCVRSLLDARQQIDFGAWLAVEPDELVARWEWCHREVLRPGLLAELLRSPPVEQAQRLLEEELPPHDVMQQRRAEILGHLPDVASHPDPTAELDIVLDNARIQGVRGKNAWESESQKQRYQEAMEKLRECVRKVQPQLRFDPKPARQAAELGLRLLRVSAPVVAAYERLKSEQAALDFDDLMVRAVALLNDPRQAALVERLSSQIALLLVDEFQDTDSLQVDLVRALCGEKLAGGKLFFVGDFKQSIYRFRGAKPQVFQQLRSEMWPEGRLPLSKNFRSQPAILDFVNALFAEALTIESEPYQKLVASRQQVGPRPAVEFLWALPEDVGQSGQEDEDETQPVGRETADQRRRREAEFVARRLRQMVDSGERRVWTKDEQGGVYARPVEPGDIVILFRALSNIDIYERALQEWGLDYYVVGGHAFYSQQEVYDLVNLLRTLESETDEVSLAGALRSPFFSLADETLFWLAEEGQTLAAGLMAESLPAALDEQQCRRARFASETIAQLRSMKDRVGIAELIQEALALTGYDAALVAEFLGPRKLANLNKLIEQARSFDRAGSFTLADFIEQLAEFVARQPKEALAATHGEGTNVVRLMSIHQAKGLEFPVVVVAEVNRKDMDGDRSSVLFDARLGPLVRHPDDERGSATGLDMARWLERQEDLAERIRLLYVATTRAADYLILSAGLGRLDKAEGTWMKLLADRFDLASGAYQGKPMDKRREPLVGVTTTQPPAERPDTALRRRAPLARLAGQARSAPAQRVVPAPWVGTVPVDLALRRRFSFSRIKPGLSPAASELEAAEGAEDVPRPGRVDPRDLGTLVHEVLAAVDFRRRGDPRLMVERHAAAYPHLTGEDREEAVRLVSRFLSSPRAGALGRASQLHVELEFLLGWPLDAPAEGGRYLQGFIDCLYADEQGQWYVLDYKTNRVTPRQVPALAEQYRLQLELYCLAAERILKTPPAAAVLHFLAAGVEHTLEWNAAAGRQAVAALGRALGEVVSPGGGP